MKRAILVLMLVVFALVTVVPTFALSQDFHGVTVPQTDEMKAGVIWDGSIVLEEGRIIAIRKAGGDSVGMEQTIVLEEGRIIAIRKAGGDQQDYL